MARQRYCRRLTRYRNPLRVSADPVGKPAAQTRAESRVLDLRKRLRERDRLSAGGRWIRTIGTPEREAYFFPAIGAGTTRKRRHRFCDVLILDRARRELSQRARRIAEPS